MLGYTPSPGADTPSLGSKHPLVQCMLGDTGNKRAVHILLECILVYFSELYHLLWNANVSSFFLVFSLPIGLNHRLYLTSARINRNIFPVSEYEQKQLTVDISSMLEDEMAWLANFQPSDNPELRETDNTLLAGHLKMIKTLLTCEGLDKKTIGIRNS